MDLDQKLCYCFHISKRKIVNFVKQTRPQRASQISECFGAGSGCGWCVPFLKEIHRQIMAGEAVEAGSISAEEYEARRRGYIVEVKEGCRDRNSYRDAAGAEAVGKEDIDVTRFFSRPQEEPAADDLKAEPEEG